MDIARGQRIKLQDLISTGSRFAVDLQLDTGGISVDSACFGLDAQRKLSDERYMTFFNQPTTPCKGVSLDGANRFEFDLERLPPTIDALVVTLAIDGPGAMNGLRPSALHVVHEGVEVAAHRFDGSAFAAERAIMLIELYRKDGGWRLNAIGQGFNGGLDALIVHFGGTVAEPAPNPPAATVPPPAAPPPAPSAAISLEKRVEKEAPHLVSLVKKVGLSLEKAGLSGHKARVALCLDISASMSRLYSSGQMAAFTERILALAARFDDDGQLDVFLFGNEVHEPEPMSLAGSRGYVERLLKRYPLEGGTRYGVAMQAIRRHFYPQGGRPGKPISDRLPVYVMFVTDGQTMDEKVSEQQIREASFEPIFWQFMGIGKSNKGSDKKKGFFARLLETDFSFLEKLDTLDGRYIDNANFFSVERPDQPSDEELYELLLLEYKAWLPLARQRGLLA
nr:VWA domain-containing protein [Zoogloeaceae bacterium]